jgi:hypothetical protein
MQTKDAALASAATFSSTAAFSANTLSASTFSAADNILNEPIRIAT